MNLSFDWKCGLTNAILSVLVYLLLLKLLPSGSGRLMHDSLNWYQSLEVLMLVSVLVAFNVNGMLFSTCMSSNTVSL